MAISLFQNEIFLVAVTAMQLQRADQVDGNASTPEKESKRSCGY
jgi:hypothetical protein